MNNENVVPVMGELEGAQLRRFYGDMSLLTDNLGKALIGKIGGPHTPLSIADLPWNGFEKGETLERLYKFEEMGIFTSEMEKKGNGYVRKFSPTAFAERLAKEAALPDPV